MIDKYRLLQLGYNELVLEYYLNNNKIELKNNHYYIKDKELLLNLFFQLKEDHDYFSTLGQSNEEIYLKLLYSLYNNAFKMSLMYINELKECLEYQEDVSFYESILKGEEVRCDFKCNESFYQIYFDLLKKYLSRRFYSMCVDIIDAVPISYLENKYKLLRKILINLEEQVDYIYENNDLVSKNMHKLERTLLLSLEINKNNIFTKNVDTLNYLYKNKNTLFFENIKELNTMYYEFIKNKRKISHRSNATITNSLDYVISTLLYGEDFYRIEELVNDSLNNGENDIKLYLYEILINRIMKYNKRNSEYIETELNLNATTDNNYKEYLKYQVNSLKSEFFLNLEDKIESKIEDYFESYKENLKKHNYHKAYKYLIKHKEYLQSNDIYVNYDYLEKELKILMLNEKEESYELRELYDLGISYYEDDNYQAAIKCFKEYLSFFNVKNPKVQALIAKCYKLKGEYLDAIFYYIEADQEFLYPTDYLDLIECLYYENNYKGIILFAKKYDLYYPEENAWLYYMLSIAYLNLGLYADAISAISTVENINLMYNNVITNLDYERNIIKRLRNKENVEIYAINNFINYDLDEEEKSYLDTVKKLKECYKFEFVDKMIEDSTFYELEDSINFLFRILKIVNYLNDSKSTKEIYDYLTSLLEKNDLKKTNQYKKMLNCYKKRN